MLALLPIAVLSACGSSASSGRMEVDVMTFNVLCSFCNNDYEPWEDRLAYFEDIMERHDPDLIGLQELTWTSEVEQFLAFRDGFEAVYFTDENPGPLGMSEYPDATILYRSARFELLENGFYWLSPTPEEAWSSGFAEGIQFPRLVNWARFLEKTTERELVFITTHFDNNSPSQDRAVPLLLERTAPWAEEIPVIVTGDFNSQPADPAYRDLTEGLDGIGFSLSNVFDTAASWSVDTNQEPPPNYDLDMRIDHIFMAEGTPYECSTWAADLYVYGQDDKYPSDHWPIVARLAF